MRRLFLITLLCIAVTPAAARSAEPDTWRIDFENNVDRYVEIQGAEVTSNPKLVLSGKRSILADFTRSEGSWHEFLHTKPLVEFKKGRTYAVRFRYRIISNDDKKIEFYSQLRSRSGKGDIGGMYWRWRRPTGHTGHINRLFEIPEDGGYYLMIGVRYHGAIVVDDLEIHEARPNEAATRLAVKTHDSPIARPRTAFERLHNTQRISEMVDDFLVITLNEGASGKASNRKDEIIRDLQPDFIDWNIFGPLAKQYGIRSSSGGCEYQEYYKVEPHDLDQDTLERTWNRRYHLFNTSGFVVSLDNTIIADESWGEGGYFTCHNGTNWHRLFTQSLCRAADRYLAITQDNIACSVFNRVHGCYCPSCQSDFRRLLPKRFSAGELKKAGVTDLEEFSIQDYIVDHGLIGRPAIEDAIVREYIKFEYTSGILAWADCVSKAKAVARRQMRPLPCGGNQINIWGSWPYAITLSQFCDFVEIEELVGVKDKVDRRSMQYKLGLASGHHEKPVWVRGPVTDQTQKQMPQLSTSYWKVHFAEGLANGGVREFSLGLNTSYTGDPKVPDYIDDQDLYGLYKEYANWMHEHRALLTRRDSAARIAIVYSLPTLMFRRVDALQTPDDYRLPKFDHAAATLEQNQIPFDVVVFGHPEIWDDAKTFDRITDHYDVIVLAGVDAMTDEQADFLRKRAQDDVTILADEAIERDENLNRRASPLDGVRTLDLSDDNLIRAGIKASPVLIDAPESVSVNAWQSCQGESFDVHLVNYDADIAREKNNPAKNVTVHVRLPDRFKFEQCTISQFGQKDQQIKPQTEDGWTEVTVPELGTYAIVSFTGHKTHELAQRDAERRREADRQRVKDLAHKYDLY